MEGLLLGALVLACPVGMGLMMWMMSKGMMGGKQADDAQSAAREPSLAELRAEHDRLANEIAQLDAATASGDERSRPSGQPEPTGEARLGSLPSA